MMKTTARLAVLAALAILPLAGCVQHDSIVLTLVSVTPTSATFEFAEPLITADGIQDHADSYEFRYSDVVGLPFNEMTPMWADFLPAPTLEAGKIISFTVPGLVQSGLYEFVVLGSYTYQGILHTEESNRIVATINADLTAPGQINDLAVSKVADNSIELSCTAPGNDGMTGAAYRYDLRYSTAGPIVTESEFSSATPVVVLPAPQFAGTVQTFVAPDLAPATKYFFAIRATDAAGNLGTLSTNPTSGTTAEHVSGGDDHGSGSKTSGGCGGSAEGSAALAGVAAMIAMALSMRR